MGLDRSRAIIDTDHAACLCRDAVVLDQSPALDSGSIAAAAEANKRLKRGPTEQESWRGSGNSEPKVTRYEASPPP